MRAAGLVIDSRRYASSTCTTAPSFMVSVLPNSPLHVGPTPGLPSIDRKSTRLNSSHIPISYAVFCLKKKNRILQQLSQFIKNKQTCEPFQNVMRRRHILRELNVASTKSLRLVGYVFFF